jgi:hypothetical protein
MVKTIISTEFPSPSYVAQKFGLSQKRADAIKKMLNGQLILSSSHRRIARAPVKASPKKKK